MEKFVKAKRKLRCCEVEESKDLSLGFAKAKANFRLDEGVCHNEAIL